MGRIRVLDVQVVNQIAAGEVIERPASVVKELVENALDAGARRIEVRLEDGGRALVEVADDGWGMDREDLAHAFLPHATSKLASAEDLLHVASLGFRGEALASIGSVARVRILSRERDAASGWAVEDREGAVGDVEPAAARPGTVVRVEGLFARVPARRRFLRAAGTERGHVVDLMGRFAVSFPEVGFRLREGERVLLEGAPEASRRARIGALHGEEVAAALLEAFAEDGDLALEGWVGRPSLTRADGRLEQVFLNGRHIRDRTVSHAIREAYRDLLPPGLRRPVAFLFLTCDPSRVDVNVHPAKAEVRWRDGGAVHRLVRRAVRPALEAAEAGVAVSLGEASTGASRAARTAALVEATFLGGRGLRLGASPPGAPLPLRDGGRGGEDLEGHGGGAGLVREGCDASGGAEEVAGACSSGPEGAASLDLRPVGQALGTYLVLEAPDAIVLVDQHALHERVLFDRIGARLREAGALEVQRLLVPVVVALGGAEAATLAEEGPLLAALGWHVEPFGEDAVAVHGVPAILRRPDPDAMLRDVLAVLAEGAREGLDRAALLDAAVDRMACRAAVMAGDPLHPEEVLALLEQAEALDHAHSCPHGRPTRLTFPRERLERWFHRA